MKNTIRITIAAMLLSLVACTHEAPPVKPAGGKAYVPQGK